MSTCPSTALVLDGEPKPGPGTAGFMPQVKWLPAGSEYDLVWQAMKDFTVARTPDTPDEIWLVEHAPVYTLGLAGKPEHVLAPAGIPLVRSDRGGQVTYHGPGQLVVYLLLDLRRLGYFVKEYVYRVEEAVIQTLTRLGLPDARRKEGAPGVYVEWPRPPQAPIELAKISALGIKIHKSCTYHGLALNVAMDLSPFLGINPCGYAGLRTIDLAACGVEVSLPEAAEALVEALQQALAPAENAK